MLLFNCSVVSNSLWHRGLQHARLPCPSLSPREFARIQVHWVSDAIQLSYPLLPPSLPSFYLSQNQGLFQWVGSSHQIPKYWSFSFSISPSTEYSGLISFGLSDLISCCLRDSQESTPAPQFESISFSALLIMVQLLHLYMLGLQGDPTSPFWRTSALGFLWKDWKEWC